MVHMSLKKLRRLRRIRWAARGTLTLGVAASVTANVLHAEPNLIAQTIAAWPPLALLITVELVSRVPVHRRSLAAVRLVATTAIASIAAWVSYWHMVGVAQRYGETSEAPYLLPVSVDGLVIVASVSLVELAGLIRTAEDKLAAEPVAGPEPARVPAEVPPVAPVLTLVTDPAEPVEVPPALPPAEPAETAAKNGRTTRPAAETRRLATALQVGDPSLSRQQIADLLGVTTRRLRDVLATPASPNGKDHS